MSDVAGAENSDSRPRSWNLMIKIMATYAQGQGPIPLGNARGIIERQDALDAIAQLAALVDETYNAGLISEKKAGFAQPPTWMSARNQLPRHPATRHTNLTLNSAALHRPIGPPQPVQLRRQRPGAVLQVLQVAVAAERPAVDAARPAAPVAGLRGARTGVVGPGPAGAPEALAEHTQLAAIVLGERVPVDVAREAVSDVGVAGSDLGRRLAAWLRGAPQRRGALRGDRR